MYLGIGPVLVMILVGLAPALWVAWWLLADLGARAGSSPATSTRSTWRPV